MSKRIYIAPDAAHLIEELAETLARDAREAIHERGVWIWAISGGSTPKALYRRLASEEWIGRFDWEKCFLLFGDDRAVPRDDPNSNFLMATQTLGPQISGRLIPIEGEETDPDLAAANYEKRIREFGPRVDCNLLGMGPDGHTASLFPRSPQLDETQKRVVATPVSTLEPFVRRVTFSFPEINAARKVYFLVTEESKAARVQEVVNGPRDVQNIPSTGVEPTDGELVWFLDEAAASKLSPRP